MLKWFTLLLTFQALCCVKAQAQQDSLVFYYNKARECSQKQDSIHYYQFIKKAVAIHPFHQGILYHAAIASALLNHREESLQYLKQAISINSEFDLKHRAFQKYKSDPDFQKIEELQHESKQPVINSDTGFVINNRSLHIECIATHPKEEKFYLGSIHQRKIVESDPKGKYTDFTTSAQDGLTAVFGIKVTHQFLWACSSPMKEMINYDTIAESAVFKYDLKTKKLLQKFTPHEPGIKEYIFGDLTLNSKGEVFISDSKNNIIFKVDEKNGKLLNFFNVKDFWNIQGITFSDDDQYLFIADYIKGIFRLDMRDKSLVQIINQTDLSLKSVDGLTYYKGSLIAIQNAIVPMRATQYFLNKRYDSITKTVIIDRGHPAFNEPTIGCMKGKMFYYVANSLWSGYNDQGLKPEIELQEVVILKSTVKD